MCVLAYIKFYDKLVSYIGELLDKYFIISDFFFNVSKLFRDNQLHHKPFTIVRVDAFTVSSRASSNYAQGHAEFMGEFGDCSTVRALPERTMTLAASLAG